MPIQVENGINWPDVISQIENLPRGEARRVSFAGTGKAMVIEHHENGLVRLQIHGADDDTRWIYPPTLGMVADIFRRGCEQRARA